MVTDTQLEWNSQENPDNWEPRREGGEGGGGAPVRKKKKALVRRFEIL